MTIKKIWKGFAAALCITALIGCGAGANEETRDQDRYAAEGNGSQENKDNVPSEGKDTKGEDAFRKNENDIPADGTAEKVDAGSLYTSAVMRGSVVEFTDGGCTVSVAITEDDGKTGVVAAPGHESDDTNVVVTYQEGCVVQIATINTSTGTAELEQASVADIKKQASVIVYGSFEDTKHVSATKIIICHWAA